MLFPSYHETKTDVYFFDVIYAYLPRLLFGKLAKTANHVGSTIVYP